MLTAPFVCTRALVYGTRDCLGDSAIRSHAVRPWVLSAIGAVFIFGAAFYWAYPVINRALLNLAFGYSALGVLAATLAFLATMVVGSLALVGCSFVFLGVFQEQVARSVFNKLGRDAAHTSGGMFQTFSRSLAAIGRTVGLLVLITTILIVALICSLVPFLAPLGFILSAWALAVQTLDPSFEALGMTLAQRLSVAWRYTYTYVCFGMLVLLVAVIPFGVVVFAPILTAAGAYVLHASALKDESSKLPSTKKVCGS